MLGTKKPGGYKQKISQSGDFLLLESYAIILGYISGFLGIALGFFIHFLVLANQSSFGIPFFSPYIPYDDLSENTHLYMEPVWKREKRNKTLNTKKPQLEDDISMKWRDNGK